MNTKSPKRRPATGTASKAGSPRKTPAQANFEDSIAIIHEEKQQLEFVIGEKDVEIERMKTTFIALNGKLRAHSDADKEACDQRTNLEQSEAQRGQLQDHITDLAQKIRKDADEHGAKHDKNRQDIQGL